MNAPESRIEGRQRVGKAPEVSRHGKTPENASTAFLAALAGLDPDTAEATRERAAICQFDGGMGRAEAERIALAGIVPEAVDPFYVLAALLDRFPLVGMAEDGRPLAAWGNPENFIRSRDELAATMRGEGDARGAGKGQRVRRFGFIPGSAGFIVIDVDRGHGDGIDGAESLAGIFAGRPVPRYFADLDAGSFPVFTRTPSGGFHLYFRYAGTKQYGPQSIAPGVEIVHFRHLITAPGSERGTRRYTLSGALDDAPAFPPVLEARCRLSADDRPAPAPRPVFTSKEERGRPSLDRIAQWAIDDGEHGGSRNRLAFEVARRARKHDYGREEVKGFLRHFGPIDGLPSREIDTATESAYRGKP